MLEFVKPLLKEEEWRAFLKAKARREAQLRPLGDATRGRPDDR